MEKKILNNYGSFDIVFEKGKGSTLWDVNGKKYIDFLSGIGVNCLGHAYKPLVKAISDQAKRQIHISNYYLSDIGLVFADELLAVTGFEKGYFGNSGAEANECEIKAARKWAAENKGPACSTIVTLENSFHGRTLTTLSATGQEHYHELYQPLTPGFASFPAGNLDALKKLCAGGTVAAVMIECVQGEGGVVALDPGFVRELAAWLKEQEILLMVDEVQTGNGRTGTMYAYMQYGLRPDVVSTAKGLAGGLPMGATLLSEKLKDVFSYGDHGSTFGGNPVAAAAALSVVSRLTDDFLKAVTRKSELLRGLLKDAPGIEALTGLGLMVGIKTTRPASEVVADCMQNGVLCLTAKDKVRLLPALNIPDELLIRAADVIKAACANA